MSFNINLHEGVYKIPVRWVTTFSMQLGAAHAYSARRSSSKIFAALSRPIKGWTEINCNLLVRVHPHLALATLFSTSRFAWLTVMSGPSWMKFCYSEMILCRLFICSPLCFFVGFRWQYRSRHRCLSPFKSTNHCSFLADKANNMANSYQYEDRALHLSRYFTGHFRVAS